MNASHPAARARANRSPSSIPYFVPETKRLIPGRPGITRTGTAAALGGDATGHLWLDLSQSGADLAGHREDPDPAMTPQSKPTARFRFTRVENERFVARSSVHGAVQGLRAPGPVLVLQVRRRVIAVDEASIDWIDGAANYVRVHAGHERHLVRGTLKDLEGVLSPRFARSHRSTIINVAAVQEFVRTRFGDLIAVLRTGDRLTVGRTYRRNIEAAFAVRI
jgi:two-component system LytT family response regulator